MIKTKRSPETTSTRIRVNTLKKLDKVFTKEKDVYTKLDLFDKVVDYYIGNK